MESSGEIWDAQGHLIGRIVKTSNGDMAFSADGRLLGTYNQATDVSFNNQGQLIGRGNHLAILIGNPQKKDSR